MSYEDLADFLHRGMRMSHIYQPAMLMVLLEYGGQAKESDIAKGILQHDESQIEYYTKITNNMVGRVLRNHGLVQKAGKNYSLIGFEELSASEVDSLIQLCRRKVAEFKEKRGAAIWSHRSKSAGYISGTLKYEVLKRAKFRCDLCGASAETRALEVGHIVPKNLKGTDDPSNLQALCYICNAMKRDRDSTDFRAVRESYSHRQPGCLFCEMKPARIIDQNELA